VKYLLGYDIGSSSVKAALVEAATGRAVGSSFSPSTEMKIASPQPGFAEQDPESWWMELQKATEKLRRLFTFQPDEVLAIGISYQMHGLVCIDKNLRPLRDAIIWCDSRAVEIGIQAFKALGEEYCLEHFLNSPGNFTASKLKWVQENQPDLYEKIYKVLLPGDYIALKLTGEPTTTVTGLSEAILWNYQSGAVAKELLNFFKIEENLLPRLVPIFGEQGRLGDAPAKLLQLIPGIPVSYRAGDQPNNAYSLNVLQPGEIAATAGTSGVVYGVTDKAEYDPLSRVNTFVHVNDKMDSHRFGILLCINGTGILNSWLRKNFFNGLSYDAINEAAASVGIGSEGLSFYPFGNGAERVLSNKDTGACLQGMQFNRHRSDHVARAAQEGIVFSLNYGIEIMQKMGMPMTAVRAGYANMFLSGVFASTFANATNCPLELYNTDGAAGAARAAGVGAKVYDNFEESFKGMKLVRRIEPQKGARQQTMDAYGIWKRNLSTFTQ
jgi:xylulokinase